MGTLCATLEWGRFIVYMQLSSRGRLFESKRRPCLLLLTGNRLLRNESDLDDYSSRERQRNIHRSDIATEHKRGNSIFYAHPLPSGISGGGAGERHAVAADPVRRAAARESAASDRTVERRPDWGKLLRHRRLPRLQHVR